MSSLIVKIAWREARGALPHFLPLLLSLMLGVGATVAVGSLAADLAAMTGQEARNILTADLEVLLTGPLSPAGELQLAQLSLQKTRSIHLTELIGMASVDAGGPTQLVEVKAVEAGYPFYGALRLSPQKADPFSDPNGVWVEASLLSHLKRRVGETVKIGDATFLIRGIIEKEPDRAVGLFSMGPRVLLSQQALHQTGLVQPGSRITRKILLAVGPSQSPEALKTFLTTAWKNETVQIRTFHEIQPRLNRFLKNFTSYLGLIGVVSLWVGGIAVAINSHGFLARKKMTIAIFKSLGVSAVSISGAYLLLVAIFGIVSGGLGVGLGLGLHRVLSGLLSGALPPDLPVLHWGVMIRGIAMGGISALLFSIWPIRVAGRASPATLLRQDLDDGRPRKWDFPGICVALVLFFCGIGLSLWQAGSWRLGLWVVGGVGLAVLLLLLSTWGVLHLLKKWGHARSLTMRYAMRNLTRPGHFVYATSIALGVGVMVLATLFQVEGVLLSHLRDNIPDDAPSLFFIDVQSDQKKSLEALLAETPLKRPSELTPLVRSRLHAMNGRLVSKMDVENRADGWYFTREYVLTFREGLPPHNQIVRGAWWSDAAREKSQGMISAEVEVARHLGLTVGSTVTFDIQGVLFEGKIGSLRAVDWGAMTTNFFFIFAPGRLEAGPVTYVASVATADSHADAALQDAVVAAFPNVTAIPIRNVLETVTRILNLLRRSMTWVAGCGLATGLGVLSGVLVATRYRRIYEMTLLRTLGAGRASLLAMMATEYAALGLLAGLVGGTLSVAVSWGIVVMILEIPWQFYSGMIFLSMAASALLAVVTGLLSTTHLLGLKPLLVLRTQ